MSAAAAAIPDTHEPLSETIECPLCAGKGKFSRTEVLDCLGIENDSPADQVWSLEELVELLGSRRQREKSERLDSVGRCG
jgi:hypothetical protein